MSGTLGASTSTSAKRTLQQRQIEPISSADISLSETQEPGSAGPGDSIECVASHEVVHESPSSTRSAHHGSSSARSPGPSQSPSNGNGFREAAATSTPDDGIGARQSSEELRRGAVQDGFAAFQDRGFHGSGAELNLGPSLACMQYRKIHRQYRGQYTKARTLGTFFVVAVMILIALFDNSSASHDAERKDRLVITLQYEIVYSNVAIPIFVMVLVIIAAHLFLMNYYNMKWGFIQSVIAFLAQIGILITASAGLPCSCISFPCTTAVVVIYGCVTFIYLSFSIIARDFLPALAAMRMFAPRIIGKSKEHEEMDMEAMNQAAVEKLLPDKPQNLYIASGSFTYIGPFFWNTRSHTCRYRGTVNEQGIPHGYGSWIDTHWQGETLEGFWEDGLPIGPFKSRETGSGSGFTCIRIGFVSCRLDDFAKPMRFTPKHASICCGVASVECCVAGAFFRGYPKADLLWEERGLSQDTAYEGCAEDLVQHLQTLLYHMSYKTKGHDEYSAPVVLRAHPRRGIQISGHYRMTAAPRDSVTVTVPIQEDPGLSSIYEMSVPESSLMQRASSDQDGWSPQGSVASDAETWSMGRNITGRNGPGSSMPRQGSLKGRGIGRTSPTKGGPAQMRQQALLQERLQGPGPSSPPSSPATVPPESREPSISGGNRPVGPFQRGGRLETAIALENAAKAAAVALQERISVSRERIAESRRRMVSSFGNRFVSSTPVHRGTAAANKYLQGIKRKKTRGRQIKYHSVSMGLIQQVTHNSDTVEGGSVLPMNDTCYERRLQIGGWLPFQGLLGVEILIHVHGYNTPLQFACQTVAQLWSFGNFPSHIKPVIFSWPTGRLFAYPWAQSRGAESERTVAAFKEMILGFARVGVRIFHFQSHSMGGRAFLNALPAIKDLFITREEANMQKAYALDRDDDEEAMNQGLRMATVTLINPEYGTHKFVECQARILKSLCDITTIYGDLKDVPLILSYYWNNTRSRLMRHNREVFIPEDVEESWKGLPPWACCWRVRDTVLGLDIYDIQDREGRPLDVDVIDCTFLQSNVEGGRHTSFTLNRSVVEDLYDVIVNRIPAQERAARLEPRGGNVYSFRVAPNFITKT